MVVESALTTSSEAFFVASATISIAALGTVGIVDYLKSALKIQEEILILQTNVLFCLIVLTFSLLPLVLAEIDGCIKICSWAILFLSTSLYGYVVWLIVSGKTLIRQRLASLPLLIFTPIVILVAALNALWLNSAVVYKLCALYALLLLLYRVILSLKYLLLSAKTDH